MRFLPNTPIKQKLMWIIWLTTATALLLACGAFLIHDQLTFKEEMTGDLSALARITGFNTTAGLSFRDPNSAAQALKGLSEDPSILRAAIYDEKGQFFAGYRRDEKAPVDWPLVGKEGAAFMRDHLDLFQRIHLAGEVIGTLYLQSDLREMETRQLSHLAISAVVFLGAVMVAFFMASRLQRIISEPIGQLVAVAGKVAVERNYSYRALKIGDDELGRLVDVFNDMLAQIQSRDDSLQKNQAQLEQRVDERTRELRERDERMLLQTTALESAANGVVIADIQGTIQWVNRAFTELTGYSAEEAIGQNPRLLKSSQHARPFYEAMWQKICGGLVWKGEIINRRKDGHCYDEEMTITPVRDSQGAISHFVAVKQDISERKRAEAELRKRTAVFQTCLDCAFEGILVVDLESNQILKNQRFYDVWRIPQHIAEDFQDQKSLEFVTNQTKDPKAFLEMVTRYYTHLESTGHDEIALMDGRTIERFTGPVRGKDGKYYGRIWTFHDITERKTAEYDRMKFVALIENSGDFISMGTLEGKAFFVNKAGREMLGLDLETDVSTIALLDCFDAETAGVLQTTGLPATFASGGWAGEGRLRHFKTHALIPVHIHSVLVRNPETHEPICLATVQRNITDIKEAEEKLEQAHRELMEISRLSGMAEIATSVLHNVGNVLNSVNVSADMIADKIKRLRPASLAKVAELLREHADDLADFLSRDPRGKALPGYLTALVEHLANPQQGMLAELAALRKNIEHIREIVRMQQSYARVSGVLETLALADLVEDAIRINAASMTRHEIQLIREYSLVPPFPMDKHKVLQILVNLLANANDALEANGGRDGKLNVRLAMNGGNLVKVSVMDNGVGIAPENLTRIFQHGFTTRKQGHGFGLHSGALAARELGGSLTAYSEGLGKGAVFTLELPCGPGKNAA